MKIYLCNENREYNANMYLPLYEQQGKFASLTSGKELSGAKGLIESKIIKFEDSDDVDSQEVQDKLLYYNDILDAIKPIETALVDAYGDEFICEYNAKQILCTYSVRGIETELGVPDDWKLIVSRRLRTLREGQRADLGDYVFSWSLLKMQELSGTAVNVPIAIEAKAYKTTKAEVMSN